MKYSACFQRGLNVLSLSSTLHVVFPFLMKSTPRWTSQGFIRAQFVSRWLTALLAVLLLTPHLAFPFLSLTILKTAQGCKDGAHCKAPAHNPTWRGSASPAAVAAVADQKLKLCEFLLKGFPRTFCLGDFLFQQDNLLQSISVFGVRLVNDISLFWLIQKVDSVARVLSSCQSLFLHLQFPIHHSYTCMVAFFWLVWDISTQNLGQYLKYVWRKCRISLEWGKTSNRHPVRGHKLQPSPLPSLLSLPVTRRSQRLINNDNSVYSRFPLFLLTLLKWPK